MKSDGLVLRAFSAFAFVFVVIHPSRSLDLTWSIASNATGRAMQRDNRCILYMDDVYKGSYCSNRTCPNWNCHDDSAVIYGTCCGCPNYFGDDHIPVLCKKNLECPKLMKDLCTDFNFMILCCCSHNKNYFSYTVQPRYSELPIIQ
ncbi:uncharacterized protein LOC112597367 [Melanaphis sacchari]|uniref:uncharacterized protein LOC112597367 n=1 Tax=Melanaphis sacchari TaxID=742174 RepID=UPI000DC15438|nr:uncharacterized protein LOC112597367 [Melanaphis sacchari]